MTKKEARELLEEYCKFLKKNIHCYAQELSSGLKRDGYCSICCRNSRYKVKLDFRRIANENK